MTKFVRNHDRLKPYRVQLENRPIRGRPINSGFTPSDIVSCVLELKLRQIGNKRGAMAEAVAYVKLVYVDINGEGSERSIYRDWQKGRVMAKGLSTEDLQGLVNPHIFLGGNQ